MVSLPADLLADLDREAALRGSSRSALLALAARRELQQDDPAEAEHALAQARRFPHAGSCEAADLVRAERDR